MILISVIIPVYNAADYLEDCLQSIINQTYGCWELIMVNDGSTDSSQQIIDQYLNKDDRMFGFHQRNGGQASARNLALEVAKGDYVMFVDSDDKISLDVMEIFINKLEIFPGLDCFQFPIFHKYGTPDATLTTHPDFLFRKEQHDFFKLLIEDKVISWIVCNKVIRSTIAKQIKFENGMVYEDNFFVLHLLNHIATLYTSSTGIYYYYEREQSTTTSALTLKKELDTLKVILLALSYLNLNAQKNMYFDTLIKAINIKKSLVRNFNFEEIILTNFLNEAKFLQVLKSNLSLKNKVKLTLAKLQLY